MADQIEICAFVHVSANLTSGCSLNVNADELWRLNRSRMRTSTAWALVARILIALSTRTFFQPDEYFQSLEVAHHAVYGYGHLTWEWLAAKPIRSIVYPAINIPLYWLLQLSGLDGTRLLVGVDPASFDCAC